MASKDQDKLCACCGSPLQGDHGYCPECHDCLGTCDWRGTDEELQRLVDRKDAEAAGAVKR